MRQNQFFETLFNVLALKNYDDQSVITDADIVSCHAIMTFDICKKYGIGQSTRFHRNKLHRIAKALCLAGVNIQTAYYGYFEKYATQYGFSDDDVKGILTGEYRRNFQRFGTQRDLYE